MGRAPNPCVGIQLSEDDFFRLIEWHKLLTVHAPATLTTDDEELLDYLKEHVLEDGEESDV